MSIAHANPVERKSKLTPLWALTLVACGLAIYVVVRHDERVTEISLGESRIVLGRSSASALKDPDQIRELVERAKVGEAPSVNAPLPSETAELRERTHAAQPTVHRLANSAATPNPANLIGAWRAQDSGAHYFIARSVDQYTFSETSSLYGIPIDTAAGSGFLDGDTLTFAYNTVFGSTGTARLTLTRDNHLSGEFRDHTTGMVAAAALVR